MDDDDADYMQGSDDEVRVPCINRCISFNIVLETSIGLRLRLF